MLSLSLATAFFLFTHAGIAGTRLRALIVERVGRTVYIVAYSVVSAIGTVWLAFAYVNAPYVELWGQLTELRAVAFVAMLCAFLFVVLGLTSRPSTLFGEQALEYRLADVEGIVRVTRHPILVGLLLWSATHTVVNGDVAALILFGSLTLLTGLGMASMDGKHRVRLGEDWHELATHTSVVPFAAVLGGRGRISFREIGWRRPSGAILIFVVALDLHARWIGVSPLPVGWF